MRLEHEKVCVLLLWCKDMQKMILSVQVVIASQHELLFQIQARLTEDNRRFEWSDWEQNRFK